MIFQQHNGANSLEYLISKFGIPKIVTCSGMNIDFHGLQVREVERYMDKILEIGRRRKSRTRVTIITGSGNHS